MTREFPKNPNVRPPYSDVQGEVDVHMGNLIEDWMYYRAQAPGYNSDVEKECNIRLQVLEQVLLRVKGVLDPDGMSEEDWQKAIAKDSFTLSMELQGVKQP